jgi:Ca2+-binding RTX toxin-like protein
MPNFIEIGNDAPASSATTYTLPVGGTVLGEYTSLVDHDWYRVSLSAGTSYTFVAYSYGAFSMSPTVTIRDGAGVAISTVGATGNNYVAAVFYTATSFGDYYIDVGRQPFGYAVADYRLGVTQNYPDYTPGPDTVYIATPGGSWGTLGGNDLVVGSPGVDVISGGGDDDNLYGGAGEDTVFGGDGIDIVVGDSGDDNLFGGAGNDTISELAAGTASGDDLIYGGTGIDIIYAADGNDIVFGGADYGAFSSTNNYINLGAGNDSATGDSATDVMLGGAGSDFLYGGAGDDSMYGETGSDFLYGGAGIDLLSGDVGNDQLYGGDGNDLLVGDAGLDELSGGVGIDILYGGVDADVINGGAGVDGLYGGAGLDTFQVGGDGFGYDYIWDFQVGDKLLFQNGNFDGNLGGGVTTSPYFQMLQNTTYSSGNSYITVPNSTGAVVVLVGFDLLSNLQAADYAYNGGFT